MTRQRSPIDWPSVRARLAAAQRALDEAGSPSTERLGKVQRRRARLLAERARNDGLGPQSSVLVFAVGAGRYAIELDALAGVERSVSLTPLPGAPPALAGVTSWRGDIIPVLDLARVLDAQATADDESAPHLVVLRRETSRLGLLVDRLEGQRPTAPTPRTVVSGPDPTGPVCAVAEDGLALLDPEVLFEHPVLQEGT